MLIIIIICSLLLAGYMALMACYIAGWQLQRDFQIPSGFNPKTSISIIIPARNEAGNIGNCIDAILAQNYSKELFEVVVVDDHSTDDTAAIVKAKNADNVNCIDLSAHISKDEKIAAYKKKAIATGIANSRGELIITTDADCIAGPDWLRNIAAIYVQQNPVMIVAPVVFTSNNSIVENFQLLDFMSMQGITAAAQRLKMGNMSNGANLAFSRAAYEEVDGYAGVDHLASGDDYLLMMKMQKAFKDRITYLKSTDAIVATPPQTDWKGFIQQRIRWASKSGKYDDSKLTLILAFVYFFNVSFLLLFVGGFFSHYLWCITVVMLLMKILIEIIFLMPVARFFHKTRYLIVFPFLQPLHIAYIITAGLLGFAGNYEWKGRKTH